MISWKYSLEKINGELELAKKKKEALEKLFNEGKVSQPTYDSFSNEVAEAITDIEAKQSMLVDKMTAKIEELEQQMRTLEHLLVNSEIRHVSGELEEEAYDRECNVLSLGLETTRQELNEIKEAISLLSEQSSSFQPSPPEPINEVNDEAEPTEPELDSEKRLEIVMDTETTTSIETTVEEPSTLEEDSPIEGEAEVPVEISSEQEEVEEPQTEEAEPFRSEESTISEEDDISETKISEEAAEEEEQD